MTPGILRSGKYVAKTASAKATSALNEATSTLNEPLLPIKQSRTTDSLSDDSESTSVQLETDTSPPPPISMKDMAFTALLGVVTAGGIAASACSMLAVQSITVFLMGGLCVLQSPAVIVNQVRIARGTSIRESIKNIRESIDVLENEITFLHSSVDELEAETEELITIENVLKKIAAEQNANVEEIVELVNENEEILSVMRKQLREIFVASMAQIILRSDTDGDMKIDTKEIPRLALRLKIQLDTFGITLDMEKFQQMLHENNDIKNVLRFCGEVLFECGSADDDDKDDDESDVTFDFEAFCMDLDEEGDSLYTHRMTKKDRISMITIKKRYSNGSVDVARGKRMTLVPSQGQREIRRKTVLKEVKYRQAKMQNYGEQRKPTSEGTEEGLFDVSNVVVVRKQKRRRDKAYEILGRG